MSFAVYLVGVALHTLAANISALLHIKTVTKHTTNGYARLSYDVDLSLAFVIMLFSLAYFAARAKSVGCRLVRGWRTETRGGMRMHGTASLFDGVSANNELNGEARANTKRNERAEYKPNESRF